MKFLLRKIFVVSLVLSLGVLGATFATAQKAAPAASQSFAQGEELVYVAEFSRALLRKIDVADFRFTATREAPLQRLSVSGSKEPTSKYSLKLTGDVTSKGFFVKLFNLKFREHVESLVEPESFTLYKSKRIDEQGKRARESEALFSDGKVFWTERDPNNPSREPRTASAEVPSHVQDVLSAIYYLRTQPLALGKTFELTVSDSGRVYKFPVRVVEKKRMKTVLGRVEALRVDPDMYGPNGMITGKGQLSIWFTNDSRRIPVSARIKTEYGTFDVTLRKVNKKLVSREYLSSNNDVQN